MGDLTKNISRHELKCHCEHCNCQSADWETLNIVQAACDHFAEQLGVEKVILKIHSAHRCEIWNEAVGGKPNSQHLVAAAIDLSIKGVHPSEIYGWLDDNYPDRLGLGLYNSFVHVDSRGRKARWQQQF